MPTNIDTKRERKDIFIHFIKNCIDDYKNDKHSFDEFSNKNFEKTIINNKKLLINIIQSIISRDNQISNNEIFDYIQEFVHQYFKYVNNWNSDHFNIIYKNFLSFLEHGVNEIDCFTPLHNFSSKLDEFQIKNSIKIRKISEEEKLWFQSIYGNYTPTRTVINEISHILIIKITKESEKSIPALAKSYIKEVIDLLRIFKEGDILRGGLYYFQRTEQWNPKNKINRIQFEPIETFSTKKYVLQSNERSKIQKFFNDASKCFPDNEHRNYLDRSIRRFSAAIEKKDIVEKILDFVISLESLLIAGVGDSTLKLSQRASILLSKNDDEIVKNYEFIKMCYNFRSGLVHESKKRDFKIKNVGKVSEKYVVLKLEESNRYLLKKMIRFSQLSKHSELSHSKLVDHIDELFLNRKLWIKYKDLT